MGRYFLCSKYVSSAKQLLTLVQPVIIRLKVLLLFFVCVCVYYLIYSLFISDILFPVDLYKAIHGSNVQGNKVKGKKYSWWVCCWSSAHGVAGDVNWKVCLEGFVRQWYIQNSVLILVVMATLFQPLYLLACFWCLSCSGLFPEFQTNC